MEVKSTFAVRLKELRGNMSQAEFGERIGVSRGSISYYENGSRTADIEILEKICCVYDVSADWLLGLSLVRKKDETVKSVCEYLGISEAAVNTIRLAQREKEEYVSTNNPYTYYWIDAISLMLEHIQFFPSLINCIYNLLNENFYEERANSFEEFIMNMEIDQKQENSLLKRFYEGIFLEGKTYRDFLISTICESMENLFDLIEAKVHLRKSMYESYERLMEMFTTIGTPYNDQLTFFLASRDEQRNKDQRIQEENGAKNGQHKTDQR